MTAAARVCHLCFTARLRRSFPWCACKRACAFVSCSHIRAASAFRSFAPSEHRSDCLGLQCHAVLIARAHDHSSVKFPALDPHTSACSMLGRYQTFMGSVYLVKNPEREYMKIFGFITRMSLSGIFTVVENMCLRFCYFIRKI